MSRETKPCMTAESSRPAVTCYEAAAACYSSPFQGILAIKGSIGAPRRRLQHIQVERNDKTHLDSGS